MSIKSEQQIRSMREACAITAEAMRAVLDAVDVGVSTYELDAIAYETITGRGAKPAFLGLYGFPATICASINEEVVHGIPSKKRILSDGDIISIDCGSIVDGMYSDMARSAIAGTAAADKQHLLASTEESLRAGISEVQPGKRVGDISTAVEACLNRHNLGIVREYVGHGVGASLHEPPQIPNFSKPYNKDMLMIGMTIAIEPMATKGSWETAVLGDKWTVVTKDGSLSAHFEDTVLVTETGYEVLTELN